MASGLMKKIDNSMLQSEQTRIYDQAKQYIFFSSKIEKSRKYPFYKYLIDGLYQ
jgi:hypothetical protein